MILSGQRAFADGEPCGDPGQSVASLDRVRESRTHDFPGAHNAAFGDREKGQQDDESKIEPAHATKKDAKDRCAPNDAIRSSPARAKNSAF